MQILKFQVDFAVKIHQNMMSTVDGVILTNQPPVITVLSRRMESQSMALVGSSRLIPSFKVFACQSNSCSLNDRHEFSKG